ncbi:sensor histidine kinase [Spirosoma aerolatum]|uniref:sensor histidine kinase n=1 Tax=Spirosoma aerolatum TaxID=1211326 RepID=UPI0009AE984E|nr:sensor histidine kinase [Spirosoma aerolatum]
MSTRSITPFDRARRWLRLTTRGGWSYVLLMPWFVPLITYFLVGEAYLQSLSTFLGATVFVWLLSTIAFIGHDWVADAIARRYPELSQTLVRAGLLCLAFIGLSTTFLTIYTWLFIRFRPFSSQLTYETVPAVFGFDLVAIFLLVGIYETSYSMYRWQQYQMNKEKLKKENLRGQLQGLRSQVNPHFLFNSLNSLSSLIAEEPKRAELFVDQMARVYRYMLQTNQRSGSAASSGRHPNKLVGPTALFSLQTPIGDESDELASLDEELAFIDSYFHLLKTRHGDGLQLNVQVADQYRQHQLPPLTLQLLVENAVKHNVILASRPLCIDILTTDQGNLVVRNNLQKKTSRSESVKMDSTQVGLNNIQAKYELLACPVPTIETGPEYFTITLPLLTKKQTNA